jgi:hypothetical protein
MRISDAQISHERYVLHDQALMAIIVYIDPPSSGVIIRGKSPDWEIEVSGKAATALSLPQKVREIAIQRFPNLKTVRVHQVQRTVQLKPDRL